jgi:periplasmic divalent cation tolerance protein
LGVVDSHEFLVVMVTAPAEAAAPIARALVERKLAACVNLLPGVRSIYRWKGEVEEADEVVLLIKTRSGAIPAMTELLEETHPHENFELLALPIEHAPIAYLNWLLDSVEVEEEEEREWFMH